MTIPISVDKNLGENVKTISRRVYANKYVGKTNPWMGNRKRFVDYLFNLGYSISYNGNNYITAEKDNETNTFYFTSHLPSNHNYLVPMVLEYRVQYFAFYDETCDSVYVMAYNKVREFCKELKYAATFGNNKRPMLFIPDNWAKQQTINTIKV